MKKKIFVILGILLILSLGTSLYILLNNQKFDTNVNNSSMAVWWWDNKTNYSYLDFAKQNKVTEIYYYASTFNDEIANFIKSANKKNIKVYWLAGEYEWIENYSLLKTKMNEFISFQKNYNNLFSGVHFDIEPHQHPEFENRREDLLYKFVDLTYKLKQNYKDLHIEYDIPCWLDDIIDYNGQKKRTFEYVFNNSSAITVMSYRDSAKKIYDFAKDEIEYAKLTNKKLTLGVETQNVNDDSITFYEEGKTYMNKELATLKQMIPENFKVAIHHINSWYELKN